MLEAPQYLQLPEVVEVRRPVEGARGEVLHVLMNEYAADLIIVVVKVLLLLQDVLGRHRGLWEKPPDDDVARLGARDDSASVVLDAGRGGGLLVLGHDFIRVIDGRSDHSAGRVVALYPCRNERAALRELAGHDAAPAELACQGVSPLRPILRQLLGVRDANLPIPVAAADHDFPAVEDEQGLVQRDACEVVLEDGRTKRVLKELLFLFAAGERGQRVQVVGLVHPHVEAHLTVDPCGSDEALVDELGLHDGLPLDQRKLALLDLLQNEGLVVLLRVLLLVDGPVDLEIYELVAHQVIFEDLLPVLLGRVLLRPELDNIGGALPVVVHLQLVGLGQLRIALAELLQVDAVLVSDARVGVEATLCVWPLLLVPEEVVDPFGDALTHVIALEGLPQPHDELIGVASSPGRQLDVIDSLAVALPPPEIYLVRVEVELGEIEEFWDDLPYVCVVAQRVLEGLLEGMEDPVRVVMGHPLKLDQGVDEWAHSGEVVEDDPRVGVVRAAVEAVIKVRKAVEVLVFLPELCLPLGRAEQLHVLR